MTKTSEYALRAMVYLVRNKDHWPIPGREIARGMGVPAKYLQKILGDLTRTGVLDSSPGRTGGFRLQRSETRIPLIEVLTPFERFESGRCPFDNAVCSDGNPCRAHHQWKRVVETEQAFYRKTTVGDIVESTEPSRRRR